MSSPTKRTLDHCKSLGWHAQVVERWIPQAKRRVDLFGFIDIVAITGSGILGIQATSTSNAPARIRKIQTETNEAARAWIRAGASISVYGWAKRGPRGKRKAWQLKEYPVTLEDLCKENSL